jgi:asparagine synthase (glutamine-hydrolysing)
MPGVVGLITRMPRERAETELRRMMAPLRHESFYEVGTWADESLGVYVGWSVRKGTFCDAMPLLNERGDRVLIFSGEDFAAPDAAAQLRKKGHDIATARPSYLVHLSEDDAAFPASVNGRFHGVLVDKTRGVVKIFNDRYGMHRLYFHEAADTVYFAVEAKAILAARPELRELDPQSLGEWISCGCVLNNRSLFKGIHALPPASVWSFENKALRTKELYFKPSEWETQGVLTDEEYYTAIRDVFFERLPRYFDSAEQIGISLTGGLDTRMILARHKGDPGSLPCYSFGSKYRECQDVVMARRVAAASGQPFQIIEVGDAFLSRFAHYAERTVLLSEGANTVNRASDLYVNEIARTIAPVRMTGNYGGEVMRQVRAFKSGKALPGLFSRELSDAVDRADASFEETVKAHPLSFAVFRQAPWHHYGLLSLEETQLSIRTPYLDNEFVRTVFRAPASACSSNDVCLRLIADADQAFRRIRTDRGLAGEYGPVQTAALRAMLEFTFKAEYAYDYGMPQWLTRLDGRLSRLRLERLFLGRHKFAHYRLWYRDVLGSYVKDILLSPRALSRPYINRSAVEHIVDSHVAGSGNYTTEIHKLLTLELVHRLFVDA